MNSESKEGNKEIEEIYQNMALKILIKKAIYALCKIILLAGWK